MGTKKTETLQPNKGAKSTKTPLEDAELLPRAKNTKNTHLLGRPTTVDARCVELAVAKVEEDVEDGLTFLGVGVSLARLQLGGRS